MRFPSTLFFRFGLPKWKLEGCSGGMQGKMLLCLGTKRSLIQEKNSGYNDYRAKREEYRRLQTVKGNIDQILRRERKPVKKQEQER